ncbi:MAG: DUF3426 domain-containing protein [Gallionellaceae bacterium]|nr:DUF3426 domain-containing protein [Gallionellaceae bacterium]
MNFSVTQCPECSTRFKVSEEQLSASEGTVRCGRCNAVFNATDHFYSEEPSPQLALPIEEVCSHEETTSESPENNEVKIETTQSDTIEHEFNFEDDSFTAEIAHPLHKKHRWPWAVGATFFLIIFLAQATYFFRVEIAAQLPGTKPALTSYCRLLKCTVPLPKKPELLSIESSDLEADTTRADAITLSALLHNRASHTQAYPNLELSLTDMHDKLVARRTFTPTEYLKAGEDAKSGLLANRDLTVKLHLDTADLKPTGYKLFLFYP